MVGAGGADAPCLRRRTRHGHRRSSAERGWSGNDSRSAAPSPPARPAMPICPSPTWTCCCGARPGPVAQPAAPVPPASASASHPISRPAPGALPRCWDPGPALGTVPCSPACPGATRCPPCPPCPSPRTLWSQCPPPRPHLPRSTWGVSLGRVSRPGFQSSPQLQPQQHPWLGPARPRPPSASLVSSTRRGGRTSPSPLGPSPSPVTSLPWSASFAASAWWGRGGVGPRRPEGVSPIQPYPAGCLWPLSCRPWPAWGWRCARGPSLRLLSRCFYCLLIKSENCSLPGRLLLPGWGVRDRGCPGLWGSPSPAVWCFWPLGFAGVEKGSCPNPLAGSGAFSPPTLGAGHSPLKARPRWRGLGGMKGFPQG